MRSSAALLDLVANTVLNVGLTNGLAIRRPIPTEASIPKNSTQPFPPVYGSQGYDPYVRGPDPVSQKCAQCVIDCYDLGNPYRSCECACYQKHQCRRSEITHGHHELKGPVGIGEFDEPPKSK